MAELIPVNYKLRVAQRERLGHWVVCGSLAAVLCIAGLTYTYMWRRHQAVNHESLQALYQDKSSLMIKADEMQARRNQLAEKMLQVQGLMDDKTLLTLLRNVSDGFGAYDCLEDIRVETHTPQLEKGGPQQGAFLVHIRGVTANSTTLTELLTRLGRRSATTGTTMSVTLESSHREKLADGQVMSFEILCHQAQEKGT